MNKYKFLTSTLLLLAAILLFWGIDQICAQSPANVQSDESVQSTGQLEQQKTAYQRRQEALKRLEDALDEGMGPALTTDEVINMPIRMGTATKAVVGAAKTVVKGSKVSVPKAASQAAGPLRSLAKAAVTPNPLYPAGIGFNPAVDYTLPNFSQSPNIRKFMDSLPGLSVANKNNLGQYIPVAKADTTTYPGSDFYDITCKQFTVQMHSDLPPTTIRGYAQVAGTGHGQTADPNVSASQYLGPAVIARVYNPAFPAGDPNTGNGKPVRMLFHNQLSLSNQTVVNGAMGQSDTLFLPLDTTIMGAGMGPTTGINYTDNRISTPHLHGGRTPWISDGTTHQWITPAGDTTPYKKGVSVQNVPDMIGAGKSIVTPAAGDGMTTAYFSNQQSARLMFYHDHAYGITRLNVYGGVAAPYLLVDQVEDDLIAGTNKSGVFTSIGITPKQILPDQNGLDNGTGLYHYGIPLVIQDKAFVNDANVPSAAAKAAFPAATSGYGHTYFTSVTDPLWYSYVNAAGKASGALWLPHEYMPIENIFDPTGNTPNGRWDYAPFMIPPMMPTNLTLPSPTLIPEAFGDTVVVNGCAFPYVELPPDTIRFRILAAGNDRVFNLQLYKADPLRINVTHGGSGYDANTLVTVTGNDPNATYTAKANVSRGEVTAIIVDSVVGNFIYAPTVKITGDGTGAKAVATWSPNDPQQLGDVVVTNGGSGYTFANVTISGGGATATAHATVILAGVIKSIDVTGAAGFRSNLAASTVVNITDPNGSGALATARACVNTEVKMVDASPNPAYPSWPVDGRDGGVPDPTTAGPDWMLIGNEGGFLAQEVNLPAQPVDYEYSRQCFPFAGVTKRSLLLLPAQRADVIVDLRGYKDGDTLILYNDAPAPMPGFWANNDYYTDDPNLGNMMRPTTPPGFGPNTRTVMQIRIKGTKTSTFNFNPNALKTAIPKAFAKSDDKPLVPQLAYNDAFPGFATSDIYAQSVDTTLNVTGAAGPITLIRTTMPGNNYTVPPKITIVGGGGSGATATAGLNPVGGINLLTTGSGYTSAPTVTIGPPNGGLAGIPNIQATAVATISGGGVNAINIVEPGSNYSTTVAPTVTVGAPGAGGVAATASAMVATANTVGSIQLTNGGSGYTHQPMVYLTNANVGGAGMGAAAVALIQGAIPMTGKSITEGFDPDFGRMDIRMGSTPNPLTPSVGTGMVLGIARYIDPPTEIVNSGELTLWRIGHLGVDSHALHFHLFDVQVVNRVDWSNVVKPPYPDEIGWRDTIRTNPMEDIIVAFRPHVPTLPFVVPTSNRLLDPTTPAGSTVNFLPVAPPVGVAAVAQLSNVMTNFGWEYVWHCHMLGHEENDFMRPLVLNVPPPVAPTTLSATAASSPTTGRPSVTLQWVDTDTAPADVSITIQRATNTGFTTGLTNTTAALTSFAAGNLVSSFKWTDTTVAANTRYYYRVYATNPAGTSANSSTVNILTPRNTPAAPTALTLGAKPTTRSITLSWTNTAGGAAAQTGVAIQRSTSATFATGVTTINVTGATVTSRTITGLVVGRTYYARVAARSGTTNSAWSNVVSWVQ
ncbi:MAG: fibronectin type III domain-containing protein [Sedimentisphaerales bacterium]